MAVRTLAFLGLCILTGACSTAGSGGSRLNANLITREQIAELTGVSDAYTVIEDLRPTWLQKRGNTSFRQEGEIRVYMDGVSVGGLDDLRNIHPDNIESIEFLDERRASFRFGPGHEHGVILVTTRR
jgi:hypothetical protein